MMLEDQIKWNKRKSYTLLFLVPLILLGLIFVTGRIFVPTASPFLVLAIGSGISTLYVLFSYFKSDQMILSVVGAEPADKEQHKQLYNLMEGLTISSGMPMPDLYIQDKNQINAFATGRKPDDGKVCVTTGAMEKLDKDELEGVLAHELAHIQNQDILFMTVAVALIGVISIISELLLHSMFFGAGNDETPPWAIAAGFALAILAPISARLVQLAMSRKREFLADASGAEITRYPEGLASALEKISNQNKKMKINKSVSHLYFSNPLKSRNMFSTHPPTEKRIERLRNM